ncbi:unnamed protein product [Fraxinus pennsylvanica]|uniref:Uncharacterized protein n=1 Tax=Fraxinus pennsylvanica TaxID=56036 RepID=A0AAD1YZ79_9LAMI|nr:unnamed protein product [Fraxinus pennsylvanica]
MVRFSCFLAHVHSHKQKKSVHLSAEAMQKPVEDTSRNQSSTSSSYPAMKNTSYLKEETDPLINTTEDSGRHFSKSVINKFIISSNEKYIIFEGRDGPTH